MTKKVLCAFRMTLANRAGQTVCEIDIDSDNAASWYMGMSLVHEQLCDSLVMKQKIQRGECVIALEEQDKRSRKRSRGEFDENGPSAKLWLTDDDLQYVLMALLRYYRDGIADVGHYDIELEPISPGGITPYLIMRFDRAAPPISGDELTRHLQ